MRSNGRPAVCEGIGCLAGKNSLRIVESVVKTDEGITIGIISVDCIVYGIECIVITSVSVFSLVIDNGSVNYYTAGREVSLEVCAVILCIPKTPFC